MTRFASMSKDLLLLVDWKILQRLHEASQLIVTLENLVLQTIGKFCSLFGVATKQSYFVVCLLKCRSTRRHYAFGFENWNSNALKHRFKPDDHNWEIVLHSFSQLYIYSCSIRFVSGHSASIRSDAHAKICSRLVLKCYGN